MKKFGCMLLAIALALFIACGVFAGKSSDKYNNYAMNDDGTYVNAYVKGEAYNYIINGTYFTGFAVYAVGCGIGGLLALICGGFMVFFDEKMDIVALKAAKNALDVARSGGAVNR